LKNEGFQRTVSGRKKHFESVRCFHIYGSSAPHHNVIVFIEFDMSGWLGEEGIDAKVGVCRDFRIVDLFVFFGPLEDNKLFHMDMPSTSCRLTLCS
jgi:hypothetical protein